MYATYYGLSQIPFGLSPDARFCYRHRSYIRAKGYMNHALYNGEGFVVVTGRPGTGKTTLIQDLLKELGALHYLVARIDSTQLEADDLLRLVAYSFGIKARGLDKATLVHGLRAFLHGRAASEGKAILIVDEAQNLCGRALEELRLITNLQLGAKPLVQIFLVGQESLRDLIREPSLEQLHQRIVAACHLEPLNLVETRAYILHRLLVAGWSGNPVFDADTLRLVFAASGGVPRLINKVCDRLLLHGSLEERQTLTAEDANLVLREFREEHLDRIDDEYPEGIPLGLIDADGPEIQDLYLAPPPPMRTPDPSPTADSSTLHPDPAITDTRRSDTPSAHNNAVSRPAADNRAQALTTNVEPAVPHTAAGSDAPLRESPAQTLPTTASSPTDQGLPTTAEMSLRSDELSSPLDAAERILALQRSRPDGPLPPPDQVSPVQTAETSDISPELRGKQEPPPVVDDDLAGTGQSRWRARTYASAAGVFLSLGGSAYLLHSHDLGSLAADARESAKAFGTRLSSLADQATSLVGPEASAPQGPAITRSMPTEIGENETPMEAGKRSSNDTANIGGMAAMQPIVRRTNPEHSSSSDEQPAPRPELEAQRGADLDPSDHGDHEPIGGGSDPSPAVPDSASSTLAETMPGRSESPDTTAQMLAINQNTSDTPEMESGESQLGPETDELILATTVEPATVAKPADDSVDSQESTGSDAEIVISFQEETGYRLTTTIQEEQTTGEADVTAASPAQLGVSSASETKIDAMAMELRGLGYRVTEDENGSLSLNLWEEVPFAFDSAEVPEQAYPALQDLANFFLRNTDTKINIIGHTDKSGPPEYNKLLSLKRAQAVEAFFHLRGLPYERLFSEGRGEETPLTGSESEAKDVSSRLRRTEILVQPLASNP